MTSQAEITHRSYRVAALVLAVAVAVIAVGVVRAATTASTSSFLRVRYNLSNESTLMSVLPDIAESPDRSTLAVVWVDGYEAGIPVGHVHLRAAPGVGPGWGDRVTVFSGNADDSAYRAAVAITDSTAHIAYVSLLSSTFEVRHRTCPLPEGPCNDDESVVRSTTNDIFWVDLALDDDGQPHIVWPEDAGGGADIKYGAYVSPSWVITDVSTTDYNKKPAVAWSDNYAHVVWQRETSSSDYDVRYSRCDPIGGCGSSVSLSGTAENENDYPPGIPVVAAGSGSVWVVWDRCANWYGPGIHCASYNLLYRRSNDGGSNWLSDTYEVGTALTYTQFLTSLQYYSSTTPAVSERKGRLNPSVALNEDGWPAIAWHTDRSGSGTDYVIYYTYSNTGTSTTVDWITRTILSAPSPAIRVAGNIGVGKEDGEDCPDIAYMLDLSPWEVMFDSNREYLKVFIPLVLKD